MNFEFRRSLVMITRSSGLNLEPVKLDAVSPNASHRCDISSKGVALQGRNDANRAPKFVHASS